MACCGPLIGLSFSCFLLFSGLFWPGPFFPIFRLWIPKRCKGVHCVDLGESFPFSNEYLLAKFGFGTAENEPCKVCSLSVYRSPRCRHRYARICAGLLSNLLHTDGTRLWCLLLNFKCSTFRIFQAVEAILISMESCVVFSELEGLRPEAFQMKLAECPLAL